MTEEKKEYCSCCRTKNGVDLDVMVEFFVKMKTHYDGISCNKIETNKTINNETLQEIFDKIEKTQDVITMVINCLWTKETLTKYVELLNSSENDINLVIIKTKAGSFSHEEFREMIKLKKDFKRYHIYSNHLKDFLDTKLVYGDCVDKLSENKTRYHIYSCFDELSVFETKAYEDTPPPFGPVPLMYGMFREINYIEKNYGEVRNLKIRTSEYSRRRNAKRIRLYTNSEDDKIYKKETIDEIIETIKGFNFDRMEIEILLILMDDIAEYFVESLIKNKLKLTDLEIVDGNPYSENLHKKITKYMNENIKEAMNGIQLEQIQKLHIEGPIKTKVEAENVSSCLIL